MTAQLGLRPSRQAFMTISTETEQTGSFGCLNSKIVRTGRSYSSARRRRPSIGKTQLTLESKRRSRQNPCIAIVAGTMLPAALLQGL
jgi:hypothetical protein